MMFVLAVVAAVLLVGPSISDLFSALQAPGRVSYYLFLVSHVFFSFKDGHRNLSGKCPDALFSFSLTNFFFFLKSKAVKEKF
jgi:hypothetical protein